MRKRKFNMLLLKTAGAILSLAVIISACSAPATIVPQPTTASVVQTTTAPQTVLIDKVPVVEKAITPTPDTTTAQAVPANSRPTTNATSAQSVPVNPQANVNATTQILNPGVVS